MRKAIGLLLVAALGLALSALAAAPPEQSKKEPFYRPFLIPGNPLDEKIKEQEKLVEADPKSASLRNDFGNLLALRRFPKEAREQYELALKLDQHNFLAPYNMGIVYETEGKISQALRAYEKCVDRNRGFPPGLFRLGRLYEKRGQDRQAIQAYAKAMRIDPAMRDPRHNPLVVDMRLLDRVSLTNYERDLATASLSADARYAAEARFRNLPYDRAIYTEETEDVEPPTPPPPAPSLLSTPRPRAPAPMPAAPGQTRPQSLVPAPASAVPPAPARLAPTPFQIITPGPIETPAQFQTPSL